MDSYLRFIENLYCAHHLVSKYFASNTSICLFQTICTNSIAVFKLSYKRNHIYIYIFLHTLLKRERYMSSWSRTVPTATSSIPKMNSTFPSLAILPRKTLALVSYSLLAASLRRRQLPDFIYFFWFRVSVLCWLFLQTFFFTRAS